MSETKRPVGRPKIYTPELANEICERIALGESLKAICSETGMPAQSTIFAWLKEIGEFSEMYARAREMQAHCMVDEIIEIADNVIEEKDAIQKAKLRIDTRKWVAAKYHRKYYGDSTDKAENQAMRSNEKDLTDEELVEKLNEIGFKS